MLGLSHRCCESGLHKLGPGLKSSRRGASHSSVPDQGVHPGLPSFPQGTLSPHHCPRPSPPSLWDGCQGWCPLLHLLGELLVFTVGALCPTPAQHWGGGRAVIVCGQHSWGQVSTSVLGPLQKAGAGTGRWLVGLVWQQWVGSPNRPRPLGFHSLQTVQGDLETVPLITVQLELLQHALPTLPSPCDSQRWPLLPRGCWRGALPASHRVALPIKAAHS